MENVIGVCVIGFVIMGFMFAFTLQSISFLRDDFKYVSKKLDKIETDLIHVKYDVKRYENIKSRD